MTSIKIAIFSTEIRSMRIFAIFLTFSFVSSASFAREIICDRNTGRSALIVIDMQPRFITRGGNDRKPANIKKVNDVITAQAEAIKKARAYGIPIVFIEYEGSFGDTNSILKDAAKNYGRVKYFKKNSDGMFESDNKYRVDLIDFLKKNNVSTLVITGANGGACVLASIQGSLDGNCTVLAYSNGIADFNYKDFIYPYVGEYKDIRPNCTDCKFRESSSINDIIEAMAKGSTISDSSPVGRTQRQGWSQ